MVFMLTGLEVPRPAAWFSASAHPRAGIHQFLTRHLLVADWLNSTWQSLSPPVSDEIGGLSLSALAALTEEREEPPVPKALPKPKGSSPPKLLLRPKRPVGPPRPALLGRRPPAVPPPPSVLSAASGSASALPPAPQFPPAPPGLAARRSGTHRPVRHPLAVSWVRVRARAMGICQPAWVMGRQQECRSSFICPRRCRGMRASIWYVLLSFQAECPRCVASELASVL